MTKQKTDGYIFDVAFSNPPFNQREDLKILSSIYKKANKIIFIHPSAWLLNRKKKNLFKVFKKTFKNNIELVELFNGNSIFNITLYPPCSFTIINNDDYYENIHVIDRIANIQYLSNIDNITVFGNDLDIVKSIENKISSKGLRNLYDMKLKIHDYDENKFHAQLSAIRGHVSYDDHKYFLNDFYTLCNRKRDICYGMRNLNARKDAFLAYQFDTEIEMKNFVDYCCSYLARFSLALLKLSQNNHLGEMSMIPYMENYSKSWEDSELYSYFNINAIEQMFIESFLGDYYLTK